MEIQPVQVPAFFKKKQKLIFTLLQFSGMYEVKRIEAARGGHFIIWRQGKQPTWLCKYSKICLYGIFTSLLKYAR